MDSSRNYEKQKTESTNKISSQHSVIIKKEKKNSSFYNKITFDSHSVD